MGIFLLVAGLLLIIAGNIKTKLELDRGGYSLEDQKKGMVPADVVPITTSIMYLSGMICLVVGGIVLILSLF